MNYVRDNMKPAARIRENSSVSPTCIYIMPSNGIILARTGSSKRPKPMLIDYFRLIQIYDHYFTAVKTRFNLQSHMLATWTCVVVNFSTKMSKMAYDSERCR